MAGCKNIISVAASLFILALVASCQDGGAPLDPASPSAGNAQVERLQQTPRSDGEAESIALCLSGELIAPQALYERVHDDLECIRAEYGTKHDWLNTIFFIPPWVPSMICVKFDLTAGDAVAAGTYHAWDSLNAALEVTEIEQFFPHTTQWWKLYFSGRKHPRRLAELYGGLPGVLVCEKNPLVYAFSNLFPSNCYFTDESVISYLFGRGEGDCYAGCLFGEFWFFVSDGETVSFDGHWNAYGPPPSGDDYIEAPSDPELLEKAKRNKADFYNF